MTIYQANRMKDIPFSTIQENFERVNDLKASGNNVIPSHMEPPDFDTLNHIKDAAEFALGNGLTAYTSNFGLIELREALATKLFRDNGLVVNTNK